MTHFVLLSAMLLAACAGGTPETSRPEASSEDACGASGLSNLVGEDLSALDAMTFPASTRFIGPHDAITMDHAPERLNVDLSEDGRVLRVWCG